MRLVQISSAQREEKKKPWGDRANSKNIMKFYTGIITEKRRFVKCY